MYTCVKCGKTFTKKYNMQRHMHHCGTTEKFHKCTVCDKSFTRSDDVKRHIRNVHQDSKMEFSPTFEIVSEEKRTTKKFHLMNRKIVFKFTAPPPKKQDPLIWLKRGVADVVHFALEHVNGEDKIGMTFDCDSFTKGCGYMSFRKASTVTMEDVWSILGKIFQSNSEGLNTDTFRLTVTYVQMPRGRGRVSTNYYNSFEEDCLGRKGIVSITNKDNLCLPRAIVVAKAYAKKDPNYPKIRKDVGKIQLLKANKLLTKAGVAIPIEGSGIREIELLQNHLRKYKITVYEYGDKGRNVIFEGPNAQQHINLLYHDGHFNVVTSLTSAFVSRYYCELCHSPYNNRSEHRCNGKCPSCQNSPPCEKIGKYINCNKCNRNFRNENCFKNHLASLCTLITRCKNCLKTVKQDRVHYCGEVFCKICQQYSPEGHLCYMQQNTSKPKLKNVLFVFFDLEARQDEFLNSISEDKIHEPNLCVLQQRCLECITESEELDTCRRCGIRRIILKISPLEMFMQFTLNQRKLFKQVICIAHNGQAYDNQFILKYILEKTQLKPDLIIMRGTKIILMEVAGIKFIDSLNYFPMALSDLPKAFDLSPVYKKGFFPHLYNTLENANYVGTLPPIQYYDPDSMKENVRKSFLEWYQQHRQDEFNMQRDLVEYCISDVQILTEACIKFRQMFLEQCGVCPFSEACTIASACNLVYRRNYLKSSTIGIIPRNGYRGGSKQSKIALQWLIGEAEKRKINIQHAANSQEVVVYGMKVDGYCRETRQVFEFNGCYYHGHTCITIRRDEPLREDSDDTLNARYERTTMKIERLHRLGFQVIQMWECDFRRMLQNPDIIKTYPNDHPLLSYAFLDPRDAFYGGRTENTRSYYKVEPGEKVNYIDVCSLYPWVCKYGTFPIGHPTIYVGEECQSLELNETEGLIKCTILPPQDLYHPVLPVKMNEKLMFVLCRTCGEQMNNHKCVHTEQERALTGSWVILEVNKAIQKGYKVLKIYEIWKYKVEKYDVLTKTGGLFTNMINTFLTIKQQASGWPANCITSEEKDRYMADFYEREGVELDYGKVDKNPGLRSLAKLILNSFWGKFGQREDQQKTSIIREPAELYALLSNPSVDVHHIQEVNEEVIIANYSFKDDAVNSLPTVNVCIAAYTTAQARLKLYDFLDLLQERALYCDTDSIFYFSRDTDTYHPETGDFLGDMTNELEVYGKQSYIEEFVSGGPKNYAYRVVTPSTNEKYTVCKVKGIRLNYKTSQLVNMESMKSMVLSETDMEPIKVSNQIILRTKEHNVVTRSEVKIYKPTSEKRKFFEDHNSLPYGHKKICK